MGLINSPELTSELWEDASPQARRGLPISVATTYSFMTVLKFFVLPTVACVCLKPLQNLWFERQFVAMVSPRFEAISLSSKELLDKIFRTKNRFVPCSFLGSSVNPQNKGLTLSDMMTKSAISFQLDSIFKNLRRLRGSFP